MSIKFNKNYIYLFNYLFIPCASAPAARPDAAPPQASCSNTAAGSSQTAS